MTKNVSGKKDKQKMFRMTGELSDRFDEFFADLKGDSAMTQDDAFEFMLKTSEEQRFANKHPGRNDEIQSFLNDLERIKDKYKASLSMYDSVKEDTEQKYKAELQEKTRIVTDLISERDNLKESIQAMETKMNAITEENVLLKETIAKLEVDLAQKDDVIISNMENNEMAKALAEAVKLLKTGAEENK